MTNPINPPAAPQVTLLSNSNYNRLKLTAQLLLPALATLIFAIAQIWNLPHGAEISGTIGAINIFAGIAVQWFKTLHDATGAGIDGTFAVDDGDDGSTLRLVNMDMNAVLTKDQLTFKVVRPVATPVALPPAA